MGAYHHGHALLNDGTLMSWGRGGEGQLGVNNCEQTLPPAAHAHFGTNVQQIVAGHDFAFAQLNDVTWQSWGMDRSGVLGLNISSPG